MNSCSRYFSTTVRDLLTEFHPTSEIYQNMAHKALMSAEEMNWSQATLDLLKDLSQALRNVPDSQVRTFSRQLASCLRDESTRIRSIGEGCLKQPAPRTELKSPTSKLSVRMFEGMPADVVYHIVSSLSAAEKNALFETVTSEDVRYSPEAVNVRKALIKDALATIPQTIPEVDESLSHLYESIYGMALKEFSIPEGRSGETSSRLLAERDAALSLNNYKDALFLDSILWESRKLLRIQCEFDRLPSSRKSLFNEVCAGIASDSSKIFSSSEVCQQVLRGMHAYSLVCFARRECNDTFAIRSFPDLISAGERICAALKGFRWQWMNDLNRVRHFLASVLANRFNPGFADYTSNASSAEKNLMLNNAGLTILPREITRLLHVTDLDLQENSLSSVPPTIAAFQDLKTLNLSGCPINTLPPEIFLLSELQKLNLGRCPLEEASPKILSFSNLTELVLDGLSVDALLPQISKLTQLTKLSLADCSTKVVPPEILMLPNLTELVLDGLSVDALLPQIAKHTQLTKLSLARCSIQEVPPEILMLPNLTGLILDGLPVNSLLPLNAIRTQLHVLSLCQCSIKEIPPEIFPFPKLANLAFDGVPVKDLLPLIATCPELMFLSLRGCDIDQLPPEFVNLTSMWRLDLSCNSLRELPPVVLDLEGLKVLLLSECSIKELPPEFASLSLLGLNLSKCPIKTFPLPIANMATLCGLDVSDCPIEVIPAEIEGLRELTNLCLDRCSLTRLPQEIANLANLRVLSLRGCPPIEIPEGLLERERAGLLVINR